MIANEDVCVRHEDDGSLLPLFMHTAVVLNPEDPENFLFDPSECRYACCECDVLGGVGVVVTYVGYTLCAGEGPNLDPAPSVFKQFGVARRIWAAWKESAENMTREECAEAWAPYADALLQSKGQSLETKAAEMDVAYDECVSKMEEKGMTKSEIDSATNVYLAHAYDIKQQTDTTEIIEHKAKTTSNQDVIDLMVIFGILFALVLTCLCFSKKCAILNLFRKSDKVEILTTESENVTNDEIMRHKETISEPGIIVKNNEVPSHILDA